MPGVVSNKSMMWKDTPIEKKLLNTSWSQDAIIRTYDHEKTDTFEKYIKNSGISYIEQIVYTLYYDNKDSITYLKDIRNDIIYKLPVNGKSKGYTLAFRLNISYQDKKEKK